METRKCKLCNNWSTGIFAFINDLEFTYSLISLTTNNSDWEELYQNMRKVQRCWGIVLAVATVRSRAMFYKAVVQAVLFCRSGSRVITDSMINVLEGLHHCIFRRITCNMARRVGVEGCE